MAALILAVGLSFLGVRAHAQLPPAQCVTTVQATGTGDAQVIPTLPCAYTTTLAVVISAGNNLSPTPTLKMGTNQALPIVKGANIVLDPGDIPAAGYRMQLNTDGQHWFLLNPVAKSSILPLAVQIDQAPSVTTTVTTDVMPLTRGGVLMNVPAGQITGGNITGLTTLAVGSLGASYTKFGAQGTLAGALGASSVDPYASLVTPYAQIAVTDDQSTNTGAGSGIAALGVYHKFGGALAGGGARMGIWSDVVQDGNLPSNADPFQTGIFSNVWAKSGTNGGAYYAYAGQVIDDLGISHFSTVGGEIDVALHSSGAQIKEGWAVGSVPLTSGPDIFQGTNYSAGYGLWAGGSCGSGALAGGSACAGFNTGISFGRSDSYWPIADAGTIIKATQGVGTQANMKAAHGIDWSLVTFSQDSIKVPGFTVTGTGMAKVSAPFAEYRLNDTNLTPTTGGLVRIASLGTGIYEWQINTAAGADFSTIAKPLDLAATGVTVTNLSATGPVSSQAAIAALYDYATPANGATVVAQTNSVGAAINPAGTIAGCTVKLPASPADGQIYNVGFSQIVSTVTWQDSGGTASNVVGAPTASAVGTSIKFIYRSAATKWYIF